jgi:hypothetical protein
LTDWHLIYRLGSVLRAGSVVTVTEGEPRGRIGGFISRP